MARSAVSRLARVRYLRTLCRSPSSVRVPSELRGRSPCRRSGGWCCVVWGALTTTPGKPVTPLAAFLPPSVGLLDLCKAVDAPTSLFLRREPRLLDGRADSVSGRSLSGSDGVIVFLA